MDLTQHKSSPDLAAGRTTSEDPDSPAVRRATGEPLLGGMEPLAARDHPGRNVRKQVQAACRGPCVREPWPTSVTVVGSLIDS